MDFNLSISSDFIADSLISTEKLDIIGITFTSHFLNVSSIGTLTPTNPPIPPANLARPITTSTPGASPAASPSALTPSHIDTKALVSSEVISDSLISTENLVIVGMTFSIQVLKLSSKGTLAPPKRPIPPLNIESPTNASTPGASFAASPRALTPSQIDTRALVSSEVISDSLISPAKSDIVGIVFSIHALNISSKGTVAPPNKPNPPANLANPIPASTPGASFAASAKTFTPSQTDTKAAASSEVIAEFLILPANVDITSVAPSIQVLNADN